MLALMILSNSGFELSERLDLLESTNSAMKADYALAEDIKASEDKYIAKIKYQTVASVII